MVIWKPLCKDGVLYVRCLIYTDYIWVWDDASIDIVDMRTFLGGHREVFVETIK